MAPKSPLDELREHVGGIDRLAAHAISMLTEQIATNGRQVETMARDLNALRNEIHSLDLKLTQFGNEEMRKKVDDHETRIRTLQDWKSNMMGRQAVISGALAAFVSFVVASVMKLVHP